MVKKFCLSFIVISILMLGFGVANNVCINSAIAEAEKEKMCSKCGHVPSKIEPDCPCECHKGQTTPPK